MEHAEQDKIENKGKKAIEKTQKSTEERPEKHAEADKYKQREQAFSKDEEMTKRAQEDTKEEYAAHKKEKAPPPRQIEKPAAVGQEAGSQVSQVRTALPPIARPLNPIAHLPHTAPVNPHFRSTTDRPLLSPGVESSAKRSRGNTQEPPSTEDPTKAYMAKSGVTVGGAGTADEPMDEHAEEGRPGEGMGAGNEQGQGDGASTNRPAHIAALLQETGMTVEELEIVQGRRAYFDYGGTSVPHSIALLNPLNFDPDSRSEDVSLLLRELARGNTSYGAAEERMDQLNECLAQRVDKAGVAWSLHWVEMFGYLCYFALRFQGQIAVVSPQFSVDYHQAQENRERLRASGENLMFGYPEIAKYVVIPVLLFDKNSNLAIDYSTASNRVGVGILERESGSVFYYDPLQPKPLISKDTKEMIKHACRTLLPVGVSPLKVGNVVCRPAKSYNKTSNVASSGFLICLYVELHLLRGRLSKDTSGHVTGTLIPNLRIEDHCRRIGQMVYQLSGGYLPRYNPPISEHLFSDDLRQPTPINQKKNQQPTEEPTTSGGLGTGVIEQGQVRWRDHAGALVTYDPYWLDPWNFNPAAESNDHVARAIREFTNMFEDQMAQLQASAARGMNAPGVDHDLHGQELFAYLGYLAMQYRGRVAVVSPQFSALFYQRHGVNRNEIRASNPEFLIGNPQTAEYVLLPIAHFHPDAEGYVDFTQATGHWTIAILERATNNVFYYDSLQPENNFSDETRATVNLAVRTLLPATEDPLRMRSFIPRPHNSYNRQRDGVSCGFFCCLFAELHLLRGRSFGGGHLLGQNRSGTFIEHLQIEDYRRRVIQTLSQIWEGHLPAYEPPTLNYPAPAEPVAVPPTTEEPRRSNPGRNQGRHSDEVNGVVDREGRRRVRDEADGNRVLFVLTELVPLTADCGENKHPGWGHGAKLANHEVNYYVSECFTNVCPYCNAYHSPYDLPKYCCIRGKVELSAQFDDYQDRPDYLRRLTAPTATGSDVAIVRNFRRDSLSYNSELAFASITSGQDRLPSGYGQGGPVCRVNGVSSYNLSDLNPVPGRDPIFGQHYTLPPEEDQEHRNNRASRQKLDADVLNRLSRLMREVNPLCVAYRDGAERLQEATRAAIQEQRPIPAFRLTILAERDAGEVRRADVHPHRTELPTADEVFRIYVDTTGEGLPPVYNGAWLQGKAGNYVPLQPWDPNIEPACFPLLFFRGQQGYTRGIARGQGPTKPTEGDAEPTSPNPALSVSEVGVEAFIDDEASVSGTQSVVAAKTKRQFVSMREYWVYMLCVRPQDETSTFLTSPHFVLDTGRVAEHFIIDIVHRIERREMDYLKKYVLPERRSALAKEFVDALEKRTIPGQRLGHYFPMPNSWIGSRAYMQQAYSNLMAIARRMGRPPTWFVTFTFDVNCEEVKKLLPNPSVSPYTRPDIICKVFIDKAEEFRYDITEGEVLGKIEAYGIVMEYQKRGAPHLHCVLWAKENDDVCPQISPEYIDQYISAEIPDLPLETDDSKEAEQQRRLHDLVVTKMLHTHKPTCMVDGKCSKYYPKRYSLHTVINTDRSPFYQRREPRPAGAQTETVETGVPRNVFEESTAEVTDVLNNPEVDDDAVEYRRRPPHPTDEPVSAEDALQYGNTYRKRSPNGVITEYNNGYVVPYNPYLLEKYGMHVNVESTRGQNCCRYIIKYIVKGHPIAYVQLTREKAASQGRQFQEDLVDVDEFQTYLECDFITSCEAYMRLLGYPILWMSHKVMTIYVKLPGEHRVVFEEGRELQADTTEPVNHVSAFFKLCAEDERAREHTLETVCHDYKWERGLKREGRDGRWVRRKQRRTNQFARLERVSPRDLNKQAFRALLLVVRGPTSALDLRRVTDENGVTTTHETYLDAAIARGLFETDELWLRTLREASDAMTSARHFRHFFATLILGAMPREPMVLFEQLLDQLVPPTQALNEHERKQKALRHIEYVLRSNESSCERVGLESPIGYIHERVEQELEDEQNAALENSQNITDGPEGGEPGGRGFTWAGYVRTNVPKLNPGQTHVYNTVMNAIRNPQSLDIDRMFMLQGAGGTGKSFVYNCIIATCKAERLNCAVTAPSGLASTLLFTGRTIQSVFGIPRELDATTPSIVEVGGEKAAFIRSLDAIIIDEISQLHRLAFEYTDKACRDVTGDDRPFGGKTVLIGGDWQQLPPVEESGGLLAIRHASVKMNKLFRDNFKTLRLTQNMRAEGGEGRLVEFLGRMGQGTSNVDGKFVEFPMECILRTLNQAIDFCYRPEHLREPLRYADELSQSAILTPHRATADEINKKINMRLPGPVLRLQATDTIIGESPLDKLSIYVEDNQLEQLHLETPSGLPPYELEVKVGSPVMLIVNLDRLRGLVNGTRLQVLEVLNNLLKCRITTGDRRLRNLQDTDIVFLPRYPFERLPTKKKPDVIPMRRTQFPIILAGAMNIMKAQGQTLKRCVIAVHQSQVFSPGMLYTGSSRVTKFSGLKVLGAQGPPGHDCRVVNIVDRVLVRDENPVNDQTQVPQTATEVEPEPMDTTVEVEQAVVDTTGEESGDFVFNFSTVGLPDLPDDLMDATDPLQEPEIAPPNAVEPFLGIDANRLAAIRDRLRATAETEGMPRASVQDQVTDDARQPRFGGGGLAALLSERIRSQEIEQMEVDEIEPDQPRQQLDQIQVEEYDAYSTPSDESETEPQA